MIPRDASAIAVLLLLTLGLTGCQKAYYGAWEQLGWHKRDILVERVEDARNQQQEVKEQFASALDKFRAVVNVEGGELQDRYDALATEYQASQAEADRVKQRIDAVEDVAGALFAEWEAELEDYSSDKLRQESARQLARTQQRYRQMIAAMREAESRMPPVLAAFQDQVLFLKHNLNARAIASIEGVSAELEQDVARLIAQMNESIAQADAFIQTLGEE